MYFSLSIKTIGVSAYNIFFAGRRESVKNSICVIQFRGLTQYIFFLKSPAQLVYDPDVVIEDDSPELTLVVQ
jgi:hypothetical protein